MSPESQSTGGLATAAGSGLTDLTLSVRQDNQLEQEVFLQHGLSLGRNPSNTICVESPNVERIHAQVLRQADGTMLLECLEPHMQIDLPNGSKVNSLKLAPGTTFKLGKATIRCLKRETKATVIVADNPWEVRCPRCHEIIAELSHDEKKCPKCNLEIQYFQSHVAANAPTVPNAITSAGGAAALGNDPFEGWLPREVGPYRIRAFVAQGGMGVVLRGLHHQLDLPAAVKLLRMDNDADPTWRVRFQAEIDTLKTLRHPNVVHLQDHGKDDKLLWLAMDWIDGQPLTKWAAKIRLEQKLIPIDEVRNVLTQVVTGLMYLHQKGIVHRDLKPSNVLLLTDSGVKLVDFGIARAANSPTAAAVTQLTHTGMVAGTESYMSPEQSEGQAVTAASDLYSLGVVWYELVTGRKPVGAFMAPDMVRQDCPQAWSQAISGCLQQEPRMRPSLEQVLYALNMRGPEPMQGRANAGPAIAPPLAGTGAQGSGVRPASGVGPPPVIAAPPVMQGGQTGFTPMSGGNTGYVPMSGPGANVGPGANTGQGAPPAYGQPNYQSPPAYGTPPNQWGQQGAAPGAGGPGGFAKFMAAVKKGTIAAVNGMGPVGRWIKTHVKESIGIAAVVLIILLVLIIRGCNSGGTPSHTSGPTTPTDPQHPTPPNNPTDPNAQTAQMVATSKQTLMNRNATQPQRQMAYMYLKLQASQGNRAAMDAATDLYRNRYLYDQDYYGIKDAFDNATPQN